MTFLCVALVSLLLGGFPHSNASSSSCGGASGMDNQGCGMFNFYCPVTNQCFDRKWRCIEKVCLDPKSGKEPNCFPDRDRQGMFEFYKKKARLRRLSSKWKANLTLPEFNHWFVEYRGFAYEFGKCFGVQELDVNDPKYKYGKPGLDIKGNTIVFYVKRMGSSSCKREEVLRFNDKWKKENPKYHLYNNNCQDYARELIDELHRNCRGKREQNEDDDNLKAPIQCFHENSSSRWSYRALLSPLISFAIFHSII